MYKIYEKRFKTLKFYKNHRTQNTAIKKLAPTKELKSAQPLTKYKNTK